MPCYLDDMSPRGGDFPAGHRYGQRPWDFGKIYWALTLAELGYTSLYLDNDVACMDDPLPADILSAPYDLQVPLFGVYGPTSYCSVQQGSYLHRQIMPSLRCTCHIQSATHCCHRRLDVILCANAQHNAGVAPAA